jgi:hypothetical protein
MNHFGIAFGVITASVIGGALFFNHSIKDKVVKAPEPAVRMASNADSSVAAPSTPAPAEVAPTITERRESPVAAAPPAKVATTSSRTAPKSGRSNVATAPRSTAPDASTQAATPSPAPLNPEPSAPATAPPAAATNEPTTQSPASSEGTTN